MRGWVNADPALVVPEGPVLGRLLAPIRRRWWLMPAAVVLVWLLVLAWLALLARPVWTAELRVYPAPSSSGVAARRGLAGLAEAGGLGALAGSLGGAEAAPPFRYFLSALAAPGVAEQLAGDPALMHHVFAGEWDAERSQWRAPSGLRTSLRGLVWAVLGRPRQDWTPPDAARLRVFLEDRVTVQTTVKSPLTVLRFSDGDPAFAAQFLQAVAEAADAQLREARAARSEANIAYLERQLALTTRVEAREALITMLSEEERQAMLSAPGLSYAAERFGQPQVSRWPSQPQPLPLLVAGLVAGLVLGAALAFWLGMRDQRRAETGLA